MPHRGTCVLVPPIDQIDSYSRLLKIVSLYSLLQEDNSIALMIAQALGRYVYTYMIVKAVDSIMSSTATLTTYVWYYVA